MSCSRENQEFDEAQIWKLPSNKSAQVSFPSIHSLRMAPLAPSSAQNYILSIQIDKYTIMQILLKIELNPVSFNQLTDSFTNAIKEAYYCILNTEQEIFERKKTF
jgi:hypothetical protein